MLNLGLRPGDRARFSSGVKPLPGFGRRISGPLKCGSMKEDREKINEGAAVGGTCRHARQGKSVNDGKLECR